MSGTTDVSAWKLMIYPVTFLLVFGAVMNLIIQPFVNDGILVQNNPTEYSDLLKNVVLKGIPVDANINITMFPPPFTITIGSVNLFEPFQNIYNGLMPDAVQNFLLNDVNTLSYLPTTMQAIITILLIISLLYSIITLLVMIIGAIPT